MEALVTHLGLNEITLVMQDWGGPIGLAFAVRRPELVRRVVLGNTWAWVTTRTEPRGLFSALVGGLRDPGFPRGDLEHVERLFPHHRTIELPDANHFFFEDEPERVISEIRAFAAADAP